ncbi:MAG: aldehyde dehydrogenase family protein, partial [Candidatus Omnitrophota bacterium]
MTERYPLYIDGKFIECSQKQNITNPSTGKVIAEVSVASEKEVELALVSARSAFDHGPWGKLTLAERKEFILKIAQGLLEQAAELAALETQNTGKPIKESTFMDIPSAAKSFEFAANNFLEYLNSEELNVCEEARGRLLREPVGVVVL